MTIGIKIGQLGYFPIPKAACTSIKAAMILVEHGRGYNPKIDINKKAAQHIHKYYEERLMNIDSCDFKFIVIRDPIKRFLSAYNNRVAHYKELTQEAIKDQNLIKQINVFQPNINQFINKFETYYKVPTINHHTRPVNTMLYDGLKTFTHVFKFEELAKLSLNLENYLGQKVNFAHLQKGKGKSPVTLRDLNYAQIEFLINFYQEDYDILKGYYNASAIWKEWRESHISQINSSPFIIWTFRRTGGTNLSKILFNQSKFEAIEHEPFNRKRKLGWVTEHWLKNKDKKSLYNNLEKILSKKNNIKHCLEILPDELNTGLAKLSTKYAYKHLFLYRADPVKRLLSLNFAMETNIWGKGKLNQKPVDKNIFTKKINIKKLINHEIHSRQEMRRIYNLINCESSPLTITFEQLYNSPIKEAAIHLNYLFKKLIGKEADHKIINNLINNGDQKTSRMYSRFSNSKELEYEAKKLEHFKLTKIPNKNNKYNLNPLVSIIIPVYNVSKYINCCLDSVINQTYSKTEIIIIDDKGKDDSIAKVKKYKDKRIKIISHKENRGLAAARNTGIDAAQGKFILFLDSDDYIDRNLITKCIQQQLINDEDILVFGSNFVDDFGNTFPNEWMEHFYNDRITNKSIDDNGVQNLVGWDVAAWSKFIRLDYLKKNHIYFLEEQRYWEDHFFSAKLYLNKGRFSNLNQKLHYYFKRSDPHNKSITQTISPKMAMLKSQVFKETCLLIEEYDKNYKNIFYPVFFSCYKFIINDAAQDKKYLIETYKNLRRVFLGIYDLNIVKNKSELHDLDLAFLMNHYSYNEFIKKSSKFNIIQQRHVKLSLSLIFSSFIFVLLSIFRLKFFKYINFLYKLRDFHVIKVFGKIDYPKKTNGLKKWIIIYDYVNNKNKYNIKINKAFDASKYLKNNPSLANIKMDLYAHFLFFAKSQNRNIEGLE